MVFNENALLKWIKGIKIMGDAFFAENCQALA